MTSSRSKAPVDTADDTPTKASFHDWVKTIATLIQAVVVVLGVGFALYELRLGTLAKELQRRQATFELIKEFNTVEVAKAQTAATQALDPLRIEEWSSIDDPRKLTEAGRELADTMSPWLMMAGTFQACIATDLCAEELALRAFCPRTTSMQLVSATLEESYSRKLDGVVYKLDLGSQDNALTDMASRCGDAGLR